MRDRNFLLLCIWPKVHSDNDLIKAGDRLETPGLTFGKAVPAVLDAPRCSVSRPFLSHPISPIQSMQDALVQHIRDRIIADVDFLVNQSLLSQMDAQAIKSKLPSGPGSIGSALQIGSEMQQLSLSSQGLAHIRAPTLGPKQQAKALWDYHQTQVSRRDYSSSRERVMSEPMLIELYRSLT